MTRRSKQTDLKPEKADKRIHSETESDRLLATDRLDTIVRAEMEQTYPLRVPLKVDMGIGPNWKEAK